MRGNTSVPQRSFPRESAEPGRSPGLKWLQCWCSMKPAPAAWPYSSSLDQTAPNPVWNLWINLQGWSTSLPISLCLLTSGSDVLRRQATNTQGIWGTTAAKDVLVTNLRYTSQYTNATSRKQCHFKKQQTLRNIFTIETLHTVTAIYTSICQP